MGTVTSSEGSSFSDLVFSDLGRYRPGERGWLKVFLRGISNPGLFACVVVRAQQVGFRKGKVKRPFLWRSVGMDIGPASTSRTLPEQ